MITIDKLQKIYNEYNINEDEYKKALFDKVKSFEKIIDDALISAASSRNNSITIVFSIPNIENIYAINNIIEKYSKAGYTIKAVDFKYKASKESIIHAFPTNEFYEYVYFLMKDLYHVFFDVLDIKMQYRMYKNNELFLDKLNTILNAKIFEISFKFSY